LVIRSGTAGGGPGRNLTPSSTCCADPSGVPEFGLIVTVTVTVTRKGRTDEEKRILVKRTERCESCPSVGDTEVVAELVRVAIGVFYDLCGIGVIPLVKLY